jgi:uncharacterized protein (UPF0333 family)
LTNSPHRPRFTFPYCDESGQSLALALVVLLVLLISGATVTQMLTSNQNLSSHERAGQQALTAADAGLDLAANAVTAAAAAATSVSSGGSVAVDGNTVTWSGAKTTPMSGNPYWTLNATARSPNGKVTKVLQEQMQQKAGGTTLQIPSIYGYGFVMGGAPSPTQYTTNTTVDNYCSSGHPVTIFGGSGAITVNTWITGDFCASGGSDPAIGNPSSASPVAVHIGGTMYDQQGPTCVVGDGSGICGNNGPVASAEIIGGCWNHHAAAKVPCDSNTQTAVNGGSGVYASNFHPVPPSPTPSKPLYDSTTEQSKYLTASPGPKDGCGAGSTGTPPANLFDSNGTLDGSLGTTDFATHMGSGTWSCKTASGELDWSWSGINGSIATLGVVGTVFFDGSFTLDGGDLIKWASGSRGNIYIDGTMAMSHNASMCATISGGSCDFSASWDPQNNQSDPLVFFAAYNRAGAAFGWTMAGASGFQGILYTNGGFSLGNGTQTMGSVFADNASVIGDGHFYVTNTPPDGALGVQHVPGTAGWEVAPRSWRECPTAGCT